MATHRAEATKKAIEGMTRPMVIIRTSGKIEIKENGGGIDLQDAIGGWIEPIDLRANGRMYCHEEGRILGLHPNWLATKLVEDAYAEPGREVFPICGDAVVVGDSGRQKDEGVPLPVLARILDLVALLEGRMDFEPAAGKEEA